MVFYIDSFFLVNFIFDFCVIVVSGRLGGVRFSLRKFLSASLLGAFFSCIAIFFPVLDSFLFENSVIALMSYVAFGYGCFGVFIKQTLILMVGFFICGGGAEAFYLGLFNTGSEMNFSVLLFSELCLMAVVFFISGKITGGRGMRYAEIVVKKNGKEYKITALFDSGNLCTDNVSGLPVIVSEDVFKDVEKRKSALFTASGVGEMQVFYPDEIIVLFENKTYTGSDVALGVINKRLSDDGSFNALIGGICFDRLVEKDAKVFKESFCRRKSFLHRDGTTASAAFKLKRGGRIFKGVKKRK